MQDMEESEEEQEVRDEIIALLSIFGDEIVEEKVYDESSLRGVVAEFPKLGSNPSVRVEMIMPRGYPSAELPMVNVSSSLLDDSVTRSMVSHLEDIFVPGEVVGFAFLSWVQEQWEQLGFSVTVIDDAITYSGARENDVSVEGEEKCDEKKQKDVDKDHEDETKKAGAGNTSSEAQKKWSGKIFHGEPLVEKKSTFQAHVAPVTSIEDVEQVMEVLLMNNKIRGATHNILAYRIEINEEGSLLQDFDDDGESAAGGRLLHLLNVLKVKNMLVVVSRWFGGILLGPSRFSFINNAARNAIVQSGLYEVEKTFETTEMVKKSTGKRK
jgi:hypothetical protein